MLEPVLAEKIQPFLFRHDPVLDMLTPTERAVVLSCCEIRSFKDGEVLFRQNAYAKGAFLVRQGLVKIAHELPTGERQIIYVAAPAEWVGYRQLMTDQAYPIGGVAVGKVETAFISAEHFHQLLHEQPAFARSLLTALSYEFSVFVYRMTVFGRFPVRDRVAICLLFLLDRFSRLEDKSNPPILFSRTDLADLVGATLETTVRALSAFREKGWLTTSGKKILLKDPRALAAEIGDY